MRALLFTIWGVCLGMIAGAQNQTAIVLHNIGKVQYFKSAGNTPMRVYPGLELNTNGFIRCQKGGSAKILYQGNTFLVSSGRLQEVAEIVKAPRTASQMGFTGRFWTFITESVQESESTEKLQKHHRRYMSKSSAAIKGYAEKDHAIAIPFLNTCKLPAATVTFKWRSTPGTGPYTFRLRDDAGVTVAQLSARDTVVTLDLEQLAMDFQKEYQWDVIRHEGKESSATVTFELTSDAVDAAKKALGQQREFQSAEATEQRLMLAYYLEQENSFYDANQLYEQMVSSNPNNLLFRKLYATFLARMDMLPEGLQVMKQ